jgi:hypothetical protein
VLESYRENIPSAVRWDTIQAVVSNLYLADACPRMKEAALYALFSNERSRPFG